MPLLLCRFKIWIYIINLLILEAKEMEEVFCLVQKRFKYLIIYQTFLQRGKIQHKWKQKQWLANVDQ